MSTGSKEDPWMLKTPPGSSGHTMYKDEQADPPTLVCQVGSTTLTYQLRAIEDLHAWLSSPGGWVRWALTHDPRTNRMRAVPASLPADPWR